MCVYCRRGSLILRFSFGRSRLNTKLRRDDMNRDLQQTKGRSALMAEVHIALRMSTLYSPNTYSVVKFVEYQDEGSILSIIQIRLASELFEDKTFNRVLQSRHR